MGRMKNQILWRALLGLVSLGLLGAMFTAKVVLSKESAPVATVANCPETQKQTKPAGKAKDPFKALLRGII